MSTACPGVVKCFHPPDPSLAPLGGDGDDALTAPSLGGGGGGRVEVAGGGSAGAGVAPSEEAAAPSGRYMVFDDLPDDYTVLRKASGDYFRIPPGFMYYEDQMLGKRYQVGAS